ncbi:MAG: DUF2891 family protein [Nitrospirales bacterium]|nr:DUF2891 domain-containing protein [Nitrospirales bacterium]
MVTRSFNQDHKDWESFCSARPEYLKILAQTVEESVLRRDTTHPTFCGCIDWHSSVHGAYALLTVARLLKQRQWVDVVDAAFKTDCLEGELASLRRGELNQELPYGYAWFLKLAQEREEGWGKEDLQPLATEIVRQLSRWMFSLSDEEVHHHARRREYGNLSWPLLNLWNWGTWKRDGELAEKLSAFTRSRLLPLDRIGPFSPDQADDEFFDPALQRYHALLTILPQEESQSWLKSVGRNNWAFLPVRMPSTPHAAGLNFSRSWGLWTLFQATQDPAFRDLYVMHIVTHMKMPQYWRDDYRKHGHWVPQFGVYAIALSMEADSI